MISARPTFGLSVILGAGAVGSLLADCLAPCSGAVQMYDRQPRRGVRTGDACAPEPALAQALSNADLVILALPEQVLWEALPVIMPHVTPGALVVETGATKVRLDQLATSLPIGVEWLGINPLFAPTLGFAGQNVAIVKSSGGPKTDLFESCMLAWGAKTVNLSAQAHDQSMALVQAAVHAAVMSFGATLADAPVDIQQLLAVSSPPFRVMLLLLGRILGQSPEVYWDIQAFNACAADTRQKLGMELSRCDQFATQPDGLPDFTAWLAHMRNALGPLQGTLHEGAKTLLACATKIQIEPGNVSAQGVVDSH